MAGFLQKYCLDHVLTNIPEKCTTPEVFSKGSSDHFPVMVTKLNREVRTQPTTIKKRHYNTFSVGNFLKDIQEHVVKGCFDRGTNSNNVDEANVLFSGIFGSIVTA